MVIGRIAPDKSPPNSTNPPEYVLVMDTLGSSSLPLASQAVGLSMLPTTSESLLETSVQLFQVKPLSDTCHLILLRAVSVFKTAVIFIFRQELVSVKLKFVVSQESLFPLRIGVPRFTLTHVDPLKLWSLPNSTYSLGIFLLGIHLLVLVFPNLIICLVFVPLWVNSSSPSSSKFSSTSSQFPFTSW